MLNVLIRSALLSDVESLAGLCFALWPESSREEHASELAALLEKRVTPLMPLVHFVAETGDGHLVGFLEADLRSHADCCDASHAVGYVEGWYVEESRRRQGIGRQLLAVAEECAREQGCVEMASDALIENELSQRAHAATGYQVVARSVLYRKPL
jgi:aminoglycoside 6'-N-acetyltransferase I